jgi:L-ascorbate metabolism protein UlaG (beta-lactamase superfamily)
VRITFLGHSCFLLKSDSYSLLIDPFIDDNPLARQKSDRVQADYILVSHGHDDHIQDVTRIAERCGSTVIALFELVNYLAGFGVKTLGLNIGGGQQLPFGWVRAVQALHSSSVLEQSLGNPCGFLIQIEGKLIYHAGDTGLFGDMELLPKLYGQIDLAMLPIGDRYTMGPKEAAYAAKLIRPKLVVPMHYNTFPAIKQDPRQFKAMLDDLDIDCRVLSVDETLEIQPGMKM